MRPLNRPMFKNGGPIKEGIMSGMKEPQAINTVGSPFAPQDASGRQKYAVQFAPLLLAAGRALARPLGKFATRAVQRTFAGPNKRFYEPAGFSKNVKESVFQPNVVGKYLMGSPEFKAGQAIVQGSGKFGAPIKKVAKGIASSPLTAGSILYYGGGALLPDGTPDPEDPKNYKPAGEGGKSGAPGGGDPGMFLTPKEKKLSTEQKDKLVSDRIEANRKRYYKLMGIDKMNKNAAYDSLIDASKIIQEEGGDLKGSIKSGNLQNRIIQAISGNLDKSADLKKQIDAAILKGEITKDINLSDPTKQADLAYKKVATEKIQKDLSGGSLIDNILVGAKAAGGSNSTSNVYNSVLKTYKTQPIVLADTAETIKLRKGDDYTNDTALVKEIVDAQNKGPGIYIIDKTAVYIDEQGNASTLFQG